MPSYRDNVKRHRARSKLEAKYHQMLREQSNEIHELKKQLNEIRHPLEVEIANLKIRAQRLEGELAKHKQERTEMLLWCPACGERHIDEGESATKEHHTHACQACGMVWRPAIGPTVGVRYLPGFKDREEATALIRRLKELRGEIAVVGHSERPQQIVDELIRLVAP